MKQFEKTLTILVSLALVLSLVNLVSTFGLYSKINLDGNAVAPTVQAAPNEAPTIVEGDLTDNDAVLGEANAPVTIVEFSDFECPFCARFHTDAWKQINEKYVKTGKVKFVYRDYPLPFHPNAQKAAESSECAKEQGKFWEMHDVLFAKGVEGGVTTFKTYAKDLGLNTAKFNDCLDSGKYESEVNKDLEDGSKYGVQGTPAFFINGVLVSGAQPFQAFQQVIEAQLSN